MLRGICTDKKDGLSWSLGGLIRITFNSAFLSLGIYQTTSEKLAMSKLIYDYLFCR